MRKMKIPDKVKVGGIVWKVEMVSELKEVNGYLDFATGIIKIDKRMPEDIKKLTLLHEIIHSINCEFEEKETQYISSILYQVLKDNFGF
jgi:hypothetical protein